MKQYYNELSKYGKFMYDLCFKGAMFLVKNKALYYTLAHTWGILLTLTGYIITTGLLIFNALLPVINWVAVKVFKKAPLDSAKLKTFYWVYYFNIGKHWGGMEMGTMFLTDSYDSDHTKKHEFGHSFQNALLGPLMPFLVSIPSATRYWDRELHPEKKHVPYDSVWFEMSATDIGTAVVEFLNKK